MSIAELFRQLKGFRNKVSIPVILMGYMNPVMQYGFEKFCSQAAAVGIDGLILPDLPIYEFENEYRAVLQKNHLDFIFLITPETGLDRIRKLDELSSGFLYLVSSSSTTGKDKNMSDQEAYFERMNSMNLRNPTLIGFGIKDKHTFQAACRYARGAIIGSAYINSLEKAEDIDIATGKFLNSILK
jgi:tryptophan synthase alpha chain